MGGARKLAAAMFVLSVACNTLTGADGLRSSQEDAIHRPTSAEGQPGDENAELKPTQGGASTSEPDAGGGSLSEDAAPEDAGTGFCATLSPAAALCTDLEEGAFPGPWAITMTASGTVAGTTLTSSSAPRGLVLTSPGATGSSAFMSASPTIAGAQTSEIELGFALRVDQAKTGEHELAVILLGSSGSANVRYELQLEVLASGQLNIEEERPQLDGAVPQSDTLLQRTVAPGAWRRVKMKLTLGSTSSSLAFSIDGAADVTVPLSAHLYKADPTIVIGHNSPTADAFAVFYDDIYVRGK